MGRAIGALVLCVVLVAPAAASAAEESTTTTSRPPRASTTTTPPVTYNQPWDAPAPEGDTEELADLSETPPPYDGPVLTVNLSSATFDPRAADAYAQWNRTRAEVEALVVARSSGLAEAARLRDAADQVRVEFDAAKAAARAGSAALRQYAVSVYMNPSVEPNRETHRGQMMAQLRDALVRSYADDRAEVKRVQARLAEAEAAVANVDRFAPTAEEDSAIATGQARVDALAAALRIFAVGDTGTPTGFRFPVGGPYRFSNSWGAPRMMGTASAHTHKGVDVFAAKATPLVAVEPGTVVRRGTDRLGGLKLWLIGDSGYVYYYAHLDGFVPDVVDGTRVAAGQTIGYVGDTGNAKGGAPHLHFEVHVRGVAVNPYPLLAVASTGDPNRR